MKERPIIFNSEMVRAILEGRKTQERRVIKPQPSHDLKWGGWVIESNCKKHEGNASWYDNPSLAFKSHYVRSKYGYSEDRLWVREKHAFVTDHRFTQETPGVFVGEDRNIHSDYSDNGLFKIFYGADTRDSGNEGMWEGGWRPSIYMPRWASRITLEITNIRLQRIQDISEEDAKKEGSIPVLRDMKASSVSVNESRQFPKIQIKGTCREDHISGFKLIWNSLHKKDGFDWNRNPWVWAIEFKKLDL